MKNEVKQACLYWSISVFCIAIQGLQYYALARSLVWNKAFNTFLFVPYESSLFWI